MALPVITNNSPSAGYISWTAFGMEYAGVGYTVAAGNTNKKFVYWHYNGGAPSLVMTDTYPDSIANEDYWLFLNKLGIGMFVDAAQVVDGSMIVSGSIYAAAIAANQISASHIVAGSIDASKIAADTITATQIAADAITTNELAAGAVYAENVQAGAITTDKLGVATVSDSLVTNGSFEEFVNGTPLGWVPTVLTGTGFVDTVGGLASSGAYSARLAPATTTSSCSLKTSPEKYIPVSSVAGRKWYISMRAGTGTAGVTSGVYLKVNWYDAAKAFISSADVMTGNQAPSTSWAVYEGQATPPSTARYMGIEAQYVNPSAVSNLYVDEIAAREVIVSAVIGDGQITTPKIVAGAITANEIAAGAITASHLTATAIDGKTITGAELKTLPDAQTGVYAQVGQFIVSNGAGTDRPGYGFVKPNSTAYKIGMFSEDGDTLSLVGSRGILNGPADSYLNLNKDSSDLFNYKKVTISTGANNQSSEIDILSGGSIYLNTGAGGSLLTNGEPILSRSAWYSMTLSGSWANYSGGGNYLGGLRCRVIGGNLQIQGMVKCNGTGQGSVIANLPSGYVPQFSAIRPIVTANASTTRAIGSMVIAVATAGVSGSLTYEATNLATPTVVSINEIVPM